MSGHSHAKKIKHQKAITDQKRGQIFSKMARVISVAVKEGGPNPESNPKLGVAMEMAKKLNLPKENIERAIKRGTGEEAANEKLEEVSFEAFGPEGIAIIIEGITDNKNRTLSEIKQILNQYNGKLVGEGAVKWLFEKRGVIIINLDSQAPKTKEELELMVIEAGAEDVRWYDNELEVYTKPEDLEKTKKKLEEKGTKIDSTSLDWVAKEEVSLSEDKKEACQKLFDALDENDSVQDVYSNLKS
jgi:YebC/PmpR family DNA-binding regulatory protein